jgi:hypothetical protein
VAVRRFPDGMGAADSRSLRSDSYVRMQHFVRRSTYVPFRRFLEDVRREFMQCLSPLQGTMGSYLHDAFQEGSVDVVACLPIPRASGSFLLFSSFYLVATTVFFCRKSVDVGRD